jgi:hypothetical protein
MGSDFSIDFCRECGMEFPDGPEEVCSICGNEIEIEDPADIPKVVGAEIDDDERCAVCKKWYEPSDERFWNYWLDLHTPAWLSVDHVWCTDCILDRLKKEHPDFESSGLEPDTFIIWKESLAMGVDLGPKLFEIEVTNAVYRLTSCAVSPEEIVRWLASDCPIDEAEKWPNFFDEFDQAMEWRNAGFGPDDDQIGEWLNWGCSPAVAAEYVNQGLEEAPGAHYRELGINLADAVYYESGGFGDYSASFCSRFLEACLHAELHRSQTVALLKDVMEIEFEIEEVHRRSQSREKIEERTYEYWDYLPRQVQQMKGAGLGITAENLLRFWGLSGREILKTIDAGGNLDVVAEVVRGGGAPGKASLIERLVETGLSASAVTTLVKRGFLLKHLRALEKTEGCFSTILSLVSLLEDDTQINVDEGLEWIAAGISSSHFTAWRRCGLTAHEAAKWIREGFHPDSARRWLESGIKSPTVAKRRHDAGIVP